MINTLNLTIRNVYGLSTFHAIVNPKHFLSTLLTRLQNASQAVINNLDYLVNYSNILISYQ